jgi:hypothetical protein
LSPQGATLSSNATNREKPGSPESTRKDLCETEEEKKWEQPTLVFQEY